MKNNHLNSQQKNTDYEEKSNSRMQRDKQSNLTQNPDTKLGNNKEVKVE